MTVPGLNCGILNVGCMRDLSLIRDQARVPCIENTSLSHWTTRGVLYLYILIVVDLCFSPYVLVD